MCPRNIFFSQGIISIYSGNLDMDLEHILEIFLKSSRILKLNVQMCFIAIGYHRTALAVIVLVVGLVSSEGMQGRRMLSVLVLVPESGPRSMGAEAFLSCDLAIDTFNKDETLTMIRKHGLWFNYTLIDTKCDVTVGLFNLVEQIVSRRDDPDSSVYAIIGKYIITLYCG